MKNKYITVVSLLICAYFAKGQVTETPFLLGTTHKLESKILNETRFLNVSTPDFYNATNDTTKLPVIYVLDGSANEDFIHICGLVQFFTMQQMMPPTIVVGIANVDRKRDFTYPTTIAKDKKTFPTTGGSAAFITFIEKEVQPFIAQKYAINGTNTIIGQSLGGLVASEILATNPDLFTQYIVVSPSLWWDGETLLPKVENSRISNKNIYVGVGKEGAIMERDARSLSKILKKKPQNRIYFDFLPKENHATVLHQAVYNALKMLYAAYTPAKH